MSLGFKRLMHVMLQEGKHITFVLLVDNYFVTI